MTINVKVYSLSKHFRMILTVTMCLIVDSYVLIKVPETSLGFSVLQNKVAIQSHLECNGSYYCVLSTIKLKSPHIARREPKHFMHLLSKEKLNFSLRHKLGITYMLRLVKFV